MKKEPPRRMLANRDSSPLKSRFETETTPMKSELGVSCVYCKSLQEIGLKNEVIMVS